jgi:hypothetical protein
MPGVAHEIVAMPGFCMFKALFSGDNPRPEQSDIFWDKRGKVDENDLAGSSFELVVLGIWVMYWI